MPGIGLSLATAFDFVWDRFIGRLQGLSDDEYFWKPVADAWTLRTDGGRLVMDGGTAPQPAPVTTIAWRIGHVGGSVLGGFAERLFSGRRLAEDQIDFPGSAAVAIKFLNDNYQRWRAGMSTLTDEQWWSALGPPWGPYAESTTADLALHVLDELIHHAAEISLLRDLYLHRESFAR